MGIYHALSEGAIGHYGCASAVQLQGTTDDSAIKADATASGLGLERRRRRKARSLRSARERSTRRRRRRRSTVAVTEAAN